MAKQTITQGTDKTTSLDVRIFEALRGEVRDVNALLNEKGPSLSAHVLEEAARRLADVARIVGVFQAHDAVPVALAGAPSVGVKIEPTGTVVATNGEDHGSKHDEIVAQGAAVAALRQEGVTWAEAAKRLEISPSQARYAFKQAKKAARAKARAAK